MNIIELPIGQIARDIPGATVLLHKLDLDYCCGGNKILREVLLDKDIDPTTIATEIHEILERSNDYSSWSEASNERLIEHILSRFHDVHREQLTELIRLAKRVEQVHGNHPECPKGLCAHLQYMQVTLDDHMQKEEAILFPMILRGKSVNALGPVTVMRNEHEEHRDALKIIDAITHNITLPEGACNTWQALYRNLEAFKKDFVEHIHLENNVLFERVDNRLS